LPARHASASEYQAIPALVTSPQPFEPCHVVDRQFAIASFWFWPGRRPLTLVIHEGRNLELVTVIAICVGVVSEDGHGEASGMLVLPVGCQNSGLGR
jgi:hypothetical protein